jgi:CRISPR-associated protein Cmr6
MVGVSKHLQPKGCIAPLIHHILTNNLLGKTMTALPTQLPRWYQLQETGEKGWTPQTSDIIDSQSKPENKGIREAWYAKNLPTYSPPVPKKAPLKAQILTPIQVGGGSIANEMILPAQIGGYPCIPGSSIKGALLSWLRRQWADIAPDEQRFWQNLIENNWQGWKPRAIRFESVPLKNLEPYPLNPQQSWQVLNNNADRSKLAVQWQAGPEEPPSTNPDKLSFQVALRIPPDSQQQKWLTQRLEETLLHQGIGRGKASGFGRLASRTPQGQWQIQLTGMKPGIQPRSKKDNIEGKYRWSPQVLRANLRGWFTRLALSQLSPDNAERLASYIFGGLACPARLNLTSFRVYAGRTINTLAQTKTSPNRHRQSEADPYANIPRHIAEETWAIRVVCNEEFTDLIGALLELAQRLGGLGPGWRRPPHSFRNDNIYRGSQFSATTAYSEMPLTELISNLQAQIRDLANHRQLPVAPPHDLPHGSVHNIWRSDNPEQWRDIVHGVCSTSPPAGSENRPAWCGDTANRPSGYSARQHKDHCLITIFESEIATTLRQQGFHCIWPAG